MSKSSATINRKFDPCLLGSKPDFTVMTTKPGNYIELLLGGIKPQKSSASPQMPIPSPINDEDDSTDSINLEQEQNYIIF
nr:5891_t:CDS:2 [Entrophospora candida]